jgi:hypothetical protein
MSQLLTFRSIQKLRFFLAGVFPFLARTPRWASGEPPKWLERYPRISKWWNTLRQSVLRANAERVATTFALGQYNDKQLDWAKVPADAAPLLRSVIVLGALLCLLLPLAIKLAWPALPLESIKGVAGEPVAGWSVWLWMIAVAIGWSCALAGTAVASRAAFIPMIVLFVYFGVVTVAALPKSWWNLLVPAQGAFALAYCEAHRARVTGRDRALGIAVASIGGMAIAFALIVAAPITGLFRGSLKTWVFLVGLALGFAVWLMGGWMQRRAEEKADWKLVRLDTTVAILGAAHFLLLTILVLRGGLVAPAQGIASFSVSVTGYLWPFYYFLGIGVVFKVLRQTKAIHSAASELIPARFFVPFALGLLTLTTIVAWSEAVVARPALPWPGWFEAISEAIYSATAWLWTRRVFGLTLPPMKWVLLIALAVAVWALIKRRFHSGVAAGLVFTVMLLWLGMFEYYFEYTGFGRSYHHTALTLLIFSAFVLWLTHRTLFDFLTGASPWWPQRARIAVYGAGIMFVLLPLHARAALHDGTLPNEIFLYLFFGVVDLGLPYYLYVYAQRRFKALPLSVPTMLGLFCAGAALSVPLILLDKLALAGWSPGAMWARATAQAAALLQGQPLDAPLLLQSPAWIVLRGALAISAIAVVAALTRRAVRDVRLAPAAVIFAAVGVAAGLASFSNRSVELPLVPLRIAQLITPLHTSIAVDATLIARHLSYFLPAMLVGVAMADSGPRSRLWLGLSLAFLLHISIGLLWPAGEAWLRSTDVLSLVGTAGVVVFVWLAATVRDRLDSVLEPNAPAPADARESARLMLTPDLRWTCATVLLVLGLLTAYRAYAGRLVTHQVASVAPTRLPAAWQQVDSVPAEPSPALALATESTSGVTSMLWADVRAFEPGESRAWLQTVAMQTAEKLSDYNPVKLEKWDRYYPGGLALDFRYLATPGDSGTATLGTTVLAPMPNGQAFVATVTYAPSELARRWDLARALSSLSR